MRAIFVRKPATLEDIFDGMEARRRGHTPGEEAYVAAEIILAAGEWEAFASGMLRDRHWIREFNEQNHKARNGAVPCLRVSTANLNYAVLINTSGYDYARYAAIDPA